jgi:hypothetical protein
VIKYKYNNFNQKILPLVNDLSLEEWEWRELRREFKFEGEGEWEWCELRREWWFKFDPFPIKIIKFNKEIKYKYNNFNQKILPLVNDLPLGEREWRDLWREFKFEGEGEWEWRELQRELRFEFDSFPIKL